MAGLRNDTIAKIDCGTMSHTGMRKSTRSSKASTTLHILLARDAPLGLVIRRGPSKRVCALAWDRETDRFVPGQWLNGRIYERRCDLSPDGKYFIYLAADYSGRKRKVGKSWTAISRAPFLKALALFENMGTWNGGGLFTSNRTYWWNAGHARQAHLETTKLSRDTTAYPSGLLENNEDLGVYYRRLERDGWAWSGPRPSHWAGPQVFEKALPGGWTLRKLANIEDSLRENRSCYWDKHELVHPEERKTLESPNWAWADWDRHRLVWTTEGQLWAALLTREGLADQTMLHDFSQMLFEKIQAPY